jgi:4-amino-4-deoxy-L-arabinose transferase-like glycosyltransferase
LFKTKYFLLSVILLALIIRIGFILTLEDKYYFPDSAIYASLAGNLSTGNGFISGTSRCRVMPGYPLFLAFLFKYAGEDIKTIRIVQAVIGACLVLIIYLTGKFAFNIQAGKIAAFIASVYPFFVFFDGLVLSETLFIFFLTLSFLFLIRYLRFHKLIDIIFYCITHSLAVYIRPSPFFILVLVLPFIFIVAKNYPHILRHIFILCIVIILMFMPWWIRNYTAFKRFIPFTLAGGQTLFESNSEKATGGPAGPVVDWPEEIYELPEYERDAFLRKAALNWIKANPEKFLHLSLIKIKRFWNIFINFKDYSTPFYNTLSILTYLPVIISGLLGLGLAIKIKSPASVLILPALYYSIIHLVFLGSIRYRVPVMPGIIVLAGFAISSNIAKPKVNIR